MVSRMSLLEAKVSVEQCARLSVLSRRHEQVYNPRKQGERNGVYARGKRV